MESNLSYIFTNHPLKRIVQVMKTAVGSRQMCIENRLVMVLNWKSSKDLMSGLKRHLK